MIRSAPSAFVAANVPPATEGARALDLACGSGRHTAVLLERGYRVTALDRDVSGLAPSDNLTVMEYDLERDGGCWPSDLGTFDLVVVVNYLWRPILPDILSAVKPGGLLIYETFRAGQETVGRPGNPDFLLKPGELSGLCADSFQVLDFFDGQDAQSGNFRQRICARKMI